MDLGHSQVWLWLEIVGLRCPGLLPPPPPWWGWTRVQWGEEEEEGVASTLTPQLLERSVSTPLVFGFWFCCHTFGLK